MGGGWALRRVINIVGDKCLAGDTEVSVRLGVSRPRKMTIATLFRRVNGNHPNRNASTATQVLADLGGYVGSHNLISVQKTGKKELFEITTEAGNKIKASIDHNFLTRNGWQSLSSGLTVGSHVYCWLGKKTGRQDRPNRFTTSGIVNHPYAWKNLTAGKNYKRLPTGRLGLEAAMNDMSFQKFVLILKKYPAAASRLQYSDPHLDLHHKDGNPLNDRLDNLQLIASPDHWQEHADDMRVDTNRTVLTKIISITNIGVYPTYDLSMENPHNNFVANGFIVHNSTAKTGLATEAMINFKLKFPDGYVRYCETEAAWDTQYAQAMGLPVDKISFNEEEVRTVEAFVGEFLKFMDKCRKQGVPGMFVLDSLDSLSDDAEMKRDLGDATYGTAKAKLLSEFFRKHIDVIEGSDVILMIVSQVRDNIGAIFGEKHKRSGGRALDFYASQVLWLAKIGNLKRTIRKVERIYGINIKGQVKKNKVSLPFREAEFEFIFGYGIEDLGASVDWLAKIGRIADAGLDKKYVEEFGKLSDADYKKDSLEINRKVKELWSEIETEFLPKRNKYG